MYVCCFFKELGDVCTRGKENKPTFYFDVVIFMLFLEALGIFALDDVSLFLNR